MDYRPAYIPIEVGLARGHQFFELVDARRSVRMFSEEQVPVEAIELAVKAANTAPSGAHQQPWTFIAVATIEIHLTGLGKPPCCLLHRTGRTWRKRSIWRYGSSPIQT